MGQAEVYGCNLSYIGGFEGVRMAAPRHQSPLQMYYVSAGLSLSARPSTIMSPVAFPNSMSYSPFLSLHPLLLWITGVR